MRILTVSQLVNELLALNAPGAQVNVTVDAEYADGAGRCSATFDGPAELVEKVFLPEGPAVRIVSRNGAKL